MSRGKTVRPSPEIIQQIRARFAAGTATKAEIAAEFGVAISTAHNWIAPPPTFVKRRRDAGGAFERDCELVAQGSMTLVDVVAKWACSIDRVRVCVRTFRPANTVPKVPKELGDEWRDAVVSRSRRRQAMIQAEATKRAALRIEVDQLSKWRLQA